MAKLIEKFLKSNLFNIYYWLMHFNQYISVYANTAKKLIYNSF